MNPSSANTSPAADRPSGRRNLILAPVLVLLGVVLAGVWFKYNKPAAGWLLAGSGGPRLSSNTREQLRQLNLPVEIRFYSVLPTGSAPEPLQDFSGRVDRLLSEFQGVNAGKIRVTRNVSTSGANADAAAADGIRPFNLDKGDACFLGITVVCEGRKESLSQLQAEWEPALEFDLARAILRIAATQASVIVRASTPVSPEVTNEIVRLIPDINGTSLDDGITTLREAAVNKFSEAGTEMEKQIQAAQQQLAKLQNGGSEAEQQAAMKHLQQVQLDQAEKIKAIAARLQAQISVFEQMKTAAVAAGTK
jgi:uncharacterized membrane protein